MPILGVMAQAVIGGLTVLVKLNPALVGSHLLISMALIAASTALVVREARPDTAPRWAVGGSTRALVVALVPLGALVLTLGTVVTGTGPHSGDQNVPYRYALNPVLVTRAHSGAVWLFLLVLLAVMLGLRRQARAADADPVRRAAVERGCGAPTSCSASRSPRGRSATCSTPPGCRGSSSACTCSAHR